MILLTGGIEEQNEHAENKTAFASGGWEERKGRKIRGTKFQSQNARITEMKWTVRGTIVWCLCAATDHN